VTLRLPEIVLDDREFQDLVNEARLRVGQRCPEWTDHNVSDPGITLIELFAWMTEVLVYRVNRIPDKLHVALLELLGMRLQPPTAARTDVRFRLAAPPEDEDVLIPAGETEIATQRVGLEEPVVFQTEQDFTIPVARPIVYAVERDGKAKDVGVARGVANPKGPDQLPFGTPPKVGDALYLGFDIPLARLLIQVDVDCSQARGAGVDPEDPPLVWESSAGDGKWHVAEVLIDRTGGFNYGSGTVELQLAETSGPDSVAGTRGQWLRCRLADRPRSGAEAIKGSAFTHPPEIYSITAAPIGALVPASQTAHEADEVLGESDGTPGQSLELRFSPVLLPVEGEQLEVLNQVSGDWEAWELVETFAESGSDDPHYALDLANGVVEFGPAIRAADGSWSQYGAVPPKGAAVRFTRYRHGGGRRGNVIPDALTILRSPVAGVAEVTNPRGALGGVDAETLDDARARAALEFRTRHRAVTASDFEVLAREASPRIARAACVPPQDGGPVRVHLLPRVDPPDRKLSNDELVPTEELFGEVGAYIDERRLIGTTVELAPMKLRGMSVVVNLQAEPRTDLGRIEDEVSYALYTYLNPLVGGRLDGVGEGWELGRALNQGELYGIVHGVPGVDFVKILRVYETDMATGKQEAKPAGTHIQLEPDETIASATHIVKAEHREY
jgi:predicted phage baseplate assembly protein